MLYRLETLYCPICDTPLGSHKRTEVVIITCPTKDCAVKWCWKPKQNVPIALEYPGKPKSKICNCESCKARDNK